MSQVGIIVATIVGAYVLCYILEFSWKLLFAAPVELDRTQRAENDRLGEAVTNLRSQLSPPQVKIEEKIFSTKTLQELLALFDEITPFQGNKKMEPYVGKWINLKGIVENTTIYSGKDSTEGS